MPCVVLEDHDIAGEKRPMSAAQVQEHSVVAGHGNDLHAGDDGGFAHNFGVHGGHGVIL